MKESAPESVNEIQAEEYIMTDAFDVENPHSTVPAHIGGVSVRQLRLLQCDHVAIPLLEDGRRCDAYFLRGQTPSLEHHFQVNSTSRGLRAG